MAELKTRIILRNDTTDGWEAVKADDTYKLLKGEIGIEFVESGSPKMKIGDGTSTWEALPYFGGTATELFETTLQSDDASKEAGGVRWSRFSKPKIWRWATTAPP